MVIAVYMQHLLPFYAQDTNGLVSGRTSDWSVWRYTLIGRILSNLGHRQYSGAIEGPASVCTRSENDNVVFWSNIIHGDREIST
jgi:hypothetical protein